MGGQSIVEVWYISTSYEKKQNGRSRTHFKLVAEISATNGFYVETRTFTYVDSVRYPPTYILLESWDCPRDN